MRYWLGMLMVWSLQAQTTVHVQVEGPAMGYTAGFRQFHSQWLVDYRQLMLGVASQIEAQKNQMTVAQATEQFLLEERARPAQEAFGVIPPAVEDFTTGIMPLLTMMNQAYNKPEAVGEFNGWYFRNRIHWLSVTQDFASVTNELGQLVPRRGLYWDAFGQQLFGLTNLNGLAALTNTVALTQAVEAVELGQVGLGQLSNALVEAEGIEGRFRPAVSNQVDSSTIWANTNNWDDGGLVAAVGGALGTLWNRADGWGDSIEQTQKNWFISMGMAAGVDLDVAAFTNMPAKAPVVAGLLEINLPGGLQFDFDLRNQEWLQPHLWWIYELARWGILLTYYVMMTALVKGYLEAQAQTKQIQFPQMRMMGNSGGWTVTPVYIGVSVVLFGVVPGMLLAALEFGWGPVSAVDVLTNPLNLISGFHPVTDALVAMFTEIFPIETFTVTVASYWIAELTLLSVYVGSQNIVRHLAAA